MKEKKTYLWLYIILAAVAYVSAYAIILAGRNYEDCVRILTLILCCWQLTFCAFLLSSYIRGNIKGLVITLIAVIFYLTMLAFIPVWWQNAFFPEYLWHCLGLISLYIGITGIIGILIGFVFNRLPEKKRFYPIVLCIIIFCCSQLEPYDRVGNINFYNPHPVKNILELKQDDFSYDSRAFLPGLFYSEDKLINKELVPDANVTEYDMKIWIDEEYLFKCIANLKVTKGNVFTLSPVMEVISVKDSLGKELEWNSQNGLLTVNECGNEISVEYICNDNTVLGVFDENICLASYSLFYPKGKEVNSNYRVTVYSDDKVFSNLEREENNVFSGQSSSVSLISGFMADETDVSGIRVIYPKLMFSTDEITEFVRNYEVLEKDWMKNKKCIILEQYITRSYMSYYDIEVIKDSEYGFLMY